MSVPLRWPERFLSLDNPSRRRRRLVFFILYDKVVRTRFRLDLHSRRVSGQLGNSEGRDGRLRPPVLRTDVNRGHTEVVKDL